MQVGKLKNRVIIRKVLVLLMCGAIGWYLKGKLTPQVPNMAAMGGGEPSVLVQKITASNICVYRDRTIRIPIGRQISAHMCIGKCCGTARSMPRRCLTST